MSIENLQTFDPFADTVDDTGEVANDNTFDYVHIRIQQRNGRKTLTTVQGLNAKIDFKRLLKAFKKEFACNGNIVDDEELGTVIQLQGDQRKLVSDFLINEGICKAANVKVHGF